MSFVEIISTAHWEGDPRLNRHVRYLEAGGHRATLITFANEKRATALGRALLAITRSKSEIVMLPDPELFLLGSVAARLSGKRPVIDIHEDYPRAAMARPWVPAVARPVVRVMADIAVRTGRLAAWRVMVAATELALRGDFVVLNIPNPATIEFGQHDGSKRLVYVGDLTQARGALDMIDLLAELDDDFELRLIGSAGEELATLLTSRAEKLGVALRVETTGRLSHREAWEAARGALAGLNLLRPVPAYRDAVATKLWEYLAAGLPPIVTDLPGQAKLIGRLDIELVCASSAEAAAIARMLTEDPVRRAELATRGRRMVESAWEEERPDLAVQAVVEP